jgi:glycosyltransferase involved in cell wall biosynthesis
MTAPLVSVSMITYNHAAYIAQAIEGVLQQQTKFHFELIIGEDCSTDGTREIVFDYQKKYPDIIRVITSDTNVGMKKNGLRTLKACRGKYIAFCEGDDYFHHPRKLQKQADYLESNPDCGLVYTNYDVYHVASRKRIKDFIDYKKWRMPENPGISDIVEGKRGKSPSIATCTVMTRRKLCLHLIEADPYLHQSDYFLMGDTQLWAEIAARARLHYLVESLATHIISDESATRSKDKKKVLQFGISGAKLQLFLCDKYNLPSHIRLKYHEYLLTCLLRLAFYTRNRELADEVRKKKRTFTLNEWVRYYGTKNITIHYIYRVSALLLNLFRTKHSQWI